MDKNTKRKIEITVLTPLHIGSGDGKLTKAEYFHDRKAGRIHIINQTEWIDLIEKSGKMNEYLEYIEKSIGIGSNSNSNNVDNIEFAGRMIKGFNPEKSDLIVRSFDFKFGTEKGGKFIPINDISTYMRDGFDKCYIPGSSLKGSIRNNIIKAALKNNNEYRKRLERELDPKKINTGNFKMDSSEYRRNVKKLIGKYESEILPKDKKYLSISDAYMDGKMDSETIMLQDYDIHLESGKESKMPSVREYISPGKKFYASANIDEEFLKNSFGNIKVDSENNFFEILGQESTRTFIDDNSAFLEIGESVFKNSINALGLNANEINPFILGANTGFHQKTVTWSVFDNVADGLDSTARILHKNDKNKMLCHDSDGDFSPRVLNTVKWKGKNVIAGLVSIRIME